MTEKKADHEEKMKMIQEKLAEFRKNKPKLQLIQRLSLYDPNYSDDYRNLSLDELKIKWKTVRPLMLKSLDKSHPPHHHNPQLARERHQTLKPIFQTLKENVEDKKCKHENRVESMDYPGRQICKDCAVVLPASFGKKRMGVFLDDESRIVKAVPVEKLMQRQFREARKPLSCINPTCPSYDAIKGYGVPLVEKIVTVNGKQQQILGCDICKGKPRSCINPTCPSYDAIKGYGVPLVEKIVTVNGKQQQILECDICKGTHSISHETSEVSKPDQNTDQLLKTLKELDPQYDINLQKYKYLTDGDLEEEIANLQKANIAIKRPFSKA